MKLKKNNNNNRVMHDIATLFYSSYCRVIKGALCIDIVVAVVCSICMD